MAKRMQPRKPVRRHKANRVRIKKPVRSSAELQAELDAKQGKPTPTKNDVVQVQVDQLPKIRTDEGVLLTNLRRRDFPKTRQGKIAFCDYMVQIFTLRKTRAESGDDERTRLVTRIEREREHLARLEARLRDLNTGAPTNGTQGQA